MEKDEFEKLYISCKSAVERFVYYKMPNKIDGDDILQEVALAAFKNADTVKNPENFKAWIIKIAVNKCNDFYRRIAQQNYIPLDETTESLVSQSRFGISETTVVRETLDNLKDKDKQILFLYYWRNKRQDEIARQLGIPIGTVKSRLYTAKQNFKEAYPFPPIWHCKVNMKEYRQKTYNYFTLQANTPVFVYWKGLIQRPERVSSRLKRNAGGQS